jgi:hypothetical protein
MTAQRLLLAAAAVLATAAALWLFGLYARPDLQLLLGNVFFLCG